MACKLAESKGLKLSPSNSVRLISPSGFISFEESPMGTSAVVSLLAGALSIPLVSGAVWGWEAGLGVRIADPGEGMRGGGRALDEDMTFALSAAAAASMRRFFSSSSSLFSLACASAARDMVRALACSNTCLSLE